MENADCHSGMEAVAMGPAEDKEGREAIRTGAAR